MVNGIAKFREYFKDCSHQYVLIGGSACDLLFEAQGLPFRPTKDFDMVLTVEVLDTRFFNRFWSFIHAGKYEVKEQGTSRCLYRFRKPQEGGFPFMLELFSRKPDQIRLPEGMRCTPIPAGEDASSLSAILLNEESYHFLQSDPVDIDGVRLARPEKLIALKAQAWLDLSGRKKSGEQIDGKNIAKHRKDIYRLSGLLIRQSTCRLPGKLGEALEKWLAEGEANPLQENDPVFANMNGPEVHALIRAVFLVNTITLVEA